MSEEETVSMLIPASPSNAASKPSVYCNGSPIKSVSLKSVCLGWQDHLSWAAHIDALQLKVSRKIVAIRRTSRRLSCAARRMFLVSITQPDLDYAAAATIPSKRASEVNWLLKLWRRAVRCAARADWRQAEIQPLLALLRLRSIERRWALQVALLVHRCHFGTTPKDLQLNLRRINPCYGTRGHGRDFTPIRPLKRSGQTCFF